MLLCQKYDEALRDMWSIHNGEVRQEKWNLM